VHGSAPDIAGKGIANPIAAIWTAALMMEHLGEAAAGQRILRALKGVVAEGRVRTPDLGGRSTTAEFTAAVISRINS
jgi:tartrate dehydrogenase/decarboxylase/D-malate dehydrogenase